MRTLAQLRHARTIFAYLLSHVLPTTFPLWRRAVSNVNDLLQTNILFTILIRLENPSSASSDSSIIPFHHVHSSKIRNNTILV